MKKTLATLSIGLSISATAGLAAEKPTGAPIRPWPAQYKIKPEEKQRLTPADVVGPDGIVYPNWTRCGVQGGIPDVKPFTTIETYGGRAGDDGDDAEALERACEAAGQSGGGAVMLGQGTYYLDRPVTVRRDGVVIKGQGAAKTRLILGSATHSSRAIHLRMAAESSQGITALTES